MLEAAGIGVAMENGAPFLKERADRIAASEPEEGVAGGDQTMGAYIKENWLFVVVAVYLVSMVLYGHYRGFVRLAVSLLRFPGAVAGGGSFWCAVCRESAS